MKGNFHVQFLGEGVAATSPPYPTLGWATTQVYPARCPETTYPATTNRKVPNGIDIRPNTLLLKYLCQSHGPVFLI